MPYKPHEILLEYLDSPPNPDEARPVLDLACGTGRSGLLLAQRDIPVVFADRSTTALDGIRQHLSKHRLPGPTWQVDLELEGMNPLAGQVFSAVICFRYLHRPLFPHLRKAVEPDGLVIYETFTVDNLRFGRPGNPDFLLKPGELKTCFQGWDVIHYYEGIQQNPDRAIAQIVARKPSAAI
jgi:tellurite methyltransferase